MSLCYLDHLECIKKLEAKESEAKEKPKELLQKKAKAQVTTDAKPVRRITDFFGTS